MGGPKECQARGCAVNVAMGSQTISKLSGVTAAAVGVTGDRVFADLLAETLRIAPQ